MAGGRPKPYLESWLRRTRKQLSSSGRLSEIAFVLAEGDSKEQEAWRSRIQKILDGEIEPEMDLVMRIDSLLAKPSVSQNALEGHLDLFK